MQIAECPLKNGEQSTTNLIKALFKNCTEGIAIFSATGKLMYISPSIENILGYTADEVMRSGWFCLIHPENHVSLSKSVKEVMANPGVPIKENVRQMRHKDGSWRWIEATVTNMLHDPEINGVVNNFHDITEKKETEDRLINTSRLYAFLSQINQAIVHAKDEIAVFEEACRIATDVGKFKGAWIGILDIANQKISLAGSSCMGPNDEVLLKNISYGSDGPQNYVLCNDTYYTCNDIENTADTVSWRPFAAQRGYHSSIVLPIRKSGAIIGTYNLYSSEKNYFNIEEISLLEEAAGDISFALDVFEKEKSQIESEQKRQESEKRLKQAQSIAHVGGWSLDFSTEVVVWSEEALRIYGMGPEEYRQTYQSWLTSVHPDDLDYVKKITKTATDGFHNVSFFHRIIRKDGHVRHIHAESQFEFDNEGKPIGLYGISHDVTEIMEAEEALKQAQYNLRMIIDLIPQSIFAKDEKGKFVFANKTFAALYGMSPDEIVNKNVVDTIPPGNKANYFIEQDLNVMKTGITTVIPEMQFTDYSGKKRIFYTTKVPYTVVGRQDKGVLGIAQDITEEKRAEAERSKMVADILYRNRDLEQFSYIVSHNLRAPVANIIGLTDLLKETEVDKEDEKIIKEGLAASAKKLDDVIRDINNTLQIRHEVQEKKEIVKFPNLLNEIKLSINNLLCNEDVIIVSDFSAVQEMPVIKSYLYSIFFNLISNSIKYHKPGERPIIEIFSSKENGKLRLIFKDNGLGIDLERNHDQVFGLYKRFHNHVDGKGIGLYMVKTQVEKLGGKITVESAVNKGCTFKIEFNIAE